MSSIDENFEIEIPDFDVTTPTRWDMNLNCSFCYNLPCFNCIVVLAVYYYEAFKECLKLQ